MTIRIGRPAPEFSAEAYMPGASEPRAIRSSDLRGDWAVLFFYPRDFTFICPTEIQAFAALHQQFQDEGAVVIAASTDSYHSHKAWFESDPRLAAVTYPVIADTAHKLSEAFDVLLEDGSALRGTFIIAPPTASCATCRSMTSTSAVMWKRRCGC